MAGLSVLRVSGEMTTAWSVAPEMTVQVMTVPEMCAERVAEDLKAAQRHAVLKAHDHDVAVAQER